MKNRQSCLGTCWLQNSSNPLSACSGPVAFARTCMSHNTAPQERILHHLVLVGFGTGHKCRGRINNEHQGTTELQAMLIAMRVWRIEE